MFDELSAAASKPGYQTSEFWRGVLLKALAVLSVVFHKDLNGTATWVPTAAAALAGLDTIAYSLGRTQVKKAAVTGYTATTHVYDARDLGAAVAVVEKDYETTKEAPTDATVSDTSVGASSTDAPDDQAALDALN